MFETTAPTETPDYALLERQLAALLEGERNWVTNMAQFCALVMHSMAGLNWAGFYLMHGEQALRLGPFQGKVACVHIPLGRGVCGSAAAQRQPIRVDDVHAFAGHIACDAASNSELVLPLLKDDRLLGVFDLDSPRSQRFSEADQQGMTLLLARLLAMSDC